MQHAQTHLRTTEPSEVSMSTCDAAQECGG
jgi:hypothetical protein